jgi:hypothetical protein
MGLPTQRCNIPSHALKEHVRIDLIEEERVKDKDTQDTGQIAEREGPQYPQETVEYTSPYKDRKGRRNPQGAHGTVEWFASHPLFQNWHDSKICNIAISSSDI